MRRSVTAAALVLVAAGAAMAAGAPAKTEAARPGVSILEANTATHPNRRIPDSESTRTIWRYWETWQPEFVKLESGPVVRADVFRPIAAAKDADGKVAKGADGKIKFDICEPKRLGGSPLPPEGWRGVDFDDSAWFRHEGPMTEGYRSLALVCVRGKFDVQDPAQAPELSLSVGFRGGLVAYLNGREIGRAALPAGEITPATLAEEYPTEAYLMPDGSLMEEANPNPWSSYVVTAEWAPKVGWQFKDPEVVARFRKRCRRLEVKVPASALRKGVNVLALEVHRAPALEAMFQHVAYNDWQAKHIVSEPKSTFLGRSIPGSFWNHAMLEDVRLSAPAAPAGLTPNAGRPRGLQVWNESVFKRVLPTLYGDSNEPLRPIRLRGVRNGTTSGQIVVGSGEAIKGLKVAVTDLKGAGGRAIPASAIQVGYVRWNQSTDWQHEGQYDALDPEPPGDLAPVTKSLWDRSRTMGVVGGVVQPVWLVVQVPRDAAPGTYAGKATVTADGEKPVETPVELRVVSDWVLPNTNEFTTYMGILESPDSVALQYNVPLWSDAHWKLLDRTFAVLADLSNREVYVTLITKTQMGNEHGMVRWVKQADGTFKHDLSLAERYVDLAVKHRWNVQMVCLYLSDVSLGRHNPYLDPPRDPPDVTVVDPATGALSEMPAPKWGTPEAQAFWKPVVEGMREVLAKRGLEKTMMFGFAYQGKAPLACIADLKVLFPDVRWAEYTHWGPKRLGDKTTWQEVGRMAWAWGSPLAVFWDPEDDPPHYNWKLVEKDVLFVAAPRAKAQVALSQTAELSEYRLTCETTLTGSHAAGGLGPGLGSYRGFGQVGADFWPVLVSPTGKTETKRLDDRYVGWGSLGLNDTIPALLAPGKSYPTHSARTQMLRESLQEAEARVFVQNALLDETLKAKLGAALAQECKAICDERTREFFFCSVFFRDSGMEYGRVFNQEAWDARTEKLYQAAGKVSAALKQ